MSKKRRSYPPQFKLNVVLESIKGEKSNVAICREHDIKESQLYAWKQSFLDQAPELFEDKRGQQRDQEMEQQAEQIAELERLVGRLTMELEMVKKAERWLGQRRRRSGK